MALLEANTGSGWFALPTPAKGDYFPSYTHLENSYVDTTGYLHRDIIRRNRAKVECGWKALSQEEMATLQNLYSQDAFWLRYTDNFGSRVEKRVYAGPLSGKVEKMQPNTYRLLLTTDVAMNFIEY